tara:strand:- start:3608 stop:4501 length:894 start_codon:yes stop_codon:yes gene_type:complete
MFSIIIPNYNRENSVVKAIDSVLNQTYSNFELIIVDDCSTDNSMNVINAIKDPRINLFKLEKNSGPAVARNVGISKSKGEYISFLDSDDQFEKEFLEKTLKTLNGTSDKIGFTWTGRRLHEDGKIKEQIWDPKYRDDTYHTFLHDIKIGTSAGITIKSEVFKKVGDFNENLLAAEDTEFFFRLSQNYDYLVIKNILVNIYRSNDDRLSKNFKKIAIAYNIFMPTHFPTINKSAVLQKKYYYKMMWLNYHLGDKTEARNYFNKIPKEKNNFNTKVIKTLYELLSIKIAYFVHKKLSKL